MFSRAVQWRDTESRENSADTQRILDVIDSYLEAWRGYSVDHWAQYLLMKALHDVCPSPGGLDLIRRWIVDEPHGSEIIEMRLCEALKFWPVSESRQLVVDSLKTLRGGPIKGVVNIFKEAVRKKERVAWTEDDARATIAYPLAETAKKTSSLAGLLYINVFAADNLLEGRCEEIGHALLQRRDSINCSAYGFHFYRKAKRRNWQAEWREWFNSSDDYKVAAACSATTSNAMSEVAGAWQALDRMYNLSVDTTNPVYLRRAAAFGISIQGRDTHAPAVLESWLNEPEPERGVLVAMGRIALRAPADRIIALLEGEINDTTNTPAQRHYPLFLLATVAPEKALSLCESDVPFPRRFEPESLLLGAATAQAMLGSNVNERTAAIRNQLTDPEPEWIREIRLRMTVPKRRAEHRVAAYARTTQRFRD